ARPPQPAHHPAERRDHAERREPRPDRVLTAARSRGRPGLRDRGDGDRRLRGRRRPRPHRRHGPAEHRARRRQAPDPPRMTAAAWTCLLLPLAAAAAITLAGGRITRRQAGYISTATTMAAFVAAIVAFVVMLGDSPEERAHYSTAWTWLSAGQYSFGL